MLLTRCSAGHPAEEREVRCIGNDEWEQLGSVECKGQNLGQHVHREGRAQECR